MKSYTDIEQSKKLAEFLPIVSADMCYIAHSELINIHEPFYKKIDKEDIPCWSLTALFNILPNGTNLVKEEADTENEHYMCTVGIKEDIMTTFASNPVDACYEMIIISHEQKLL